MSNKSFVAIIIFVLIAVMGYAVYTLKGTAPVEKTPEVAALVFTSNTEKITFNGAGTVVKPNNLVVHIVGDILPTAPNETAVSLTHTITPPIANVTLTVANASATKIDHYLTINTSATSIARGNYTLTSYFTHSTTTEGGTATYQASFPFTIKSVTASTTRRGK